MEFVTLEIIDQVVEEIRKHSSIQPKVAIILGSGLGKFADEVTEKAVVQTKDLPHWPGSTVEGHAGRVVLGELEGQKVIVLQGRAHFYEGYPMSQVGLPVRVMSRLGAEFLLVTNAAGGINQDFEPGDLMAITDHINLLGMAGVSPLRGPNIDELGDRFPDMSQAYDRHLLDLAREVAVEKGIKLMEGIYICLAGPSFETPADLRYLQSIGADAVGMSTVPEVTVARHAGLSVLGVSGISNKASLDGEAITNHEEVLSAGKLIAPKLSALFRGVLRRL
jgi:purine-nucleoside phosphorylase